MNGISADIAGSCDDALHIQVIVAGRAFSDADTLICQLYVKTVFIFFGVNGDAADAHVAAGADNADRDFSTICD